MMRPTSDHDRERLKGATDRAIKRAGGVSALAALTRVEAAALSKYKAGHEPAFMPLDVAADADMAAGSPVILAALASIEGYAIAPLSGDTASAVTPAMVGHLIRETGDVSAGVLEAMADGRLSRNERQAIAAEIDEALAALWQLRAAMNGQGGNG
jgi:hypothetical protein